MREHAVPQRTILIVDDSEDIRELVKATLESAEWTIVEAENGEQALALLRDLQPDLVVLDVKMPGIDGVEVCARMRKMEAVRDTPVVMLTAVPEEIALASGGELRVQGYLTKPFSPLQLLDKIEECLAP